MNAQTKINADQAKAILDVRNGADVYAYGLAGALREVERIAPEYISIGRAQMYRGDGTDRMPYFGAIATKAGVKAARAVLRKKKAGEA